MTATANKLKLLLSCILVSILVALTYFLFEYAVSHSITYVWDTIFNTANKRYLIIPLSLVGALLFYGLQHYFDPKSESHENHGLGGQPISPTLKNLLFILSLGFFSLLAGASLGPEAILVPACMLIGTYIGVQLFKKNDLSVKALAAAALMALMAAFFHSFIVGVLSVLLVTKQAKIKVSVQLLLIAVIASGSSYLTLKFVDPTNRYFNFPDFSWKIVFVDVTVGLLLVVAGFISTFALKYGHTMFVRFKDRAKLSTWWKLAIVAGVGLSLLYLLGGPLVEFTGNESIAPLVSQASDLGVLGVFAILLIKLLVIGWSKAMGYRGGLIFPMIFVASTLVVLSQLIFADVNFGVGIIAALIGILAAEKKAQILL